MNPLILAVALGGQLDELGIKYAVGGSVASSFYGEPRSTLDIDVAVQGDTKTLRQPTWSSFCRHIRLIGPTFSLWRTKLACVNWPTRPSSKLVSADAGRLLLE